MVKYHRMDPSYRLLGYLDLFSEISHITCITDFSCVLGYIFRTYWPGQAVA